MQAMHFNFPSAVQRHERHLVVSTDLCNKLDLGYFIVQSQNNFKMPTILHVIFVDILLSKIVF